MNLVALAKVNDRRSFCFIVAGELSFFMKFPCILIELNALPVDDAFACDSDIALVVGEDETMKIDFSVVHAVGATEQDSAFLQMQCDGATQCKRACEKAPRRNNHSASASGCSGVDGFLDKTAIQRYAIRFGAVGDNRKISRRLCPSEHQQP
jgi:hypothetical protein